MNDAFALIKTLPNRKVEVESFVSKLVWELNSGDVDPLEMKTMFKAITEVIDKVKPTLDEKALAQAEKYGTKSFKEYGCEITIKELGTKWDYSGTNDSVLGGLHADLLILQNKIKERETFLKAIKEPMSVASEATDGEQITIYPPVKKSTTGLAIQLV